MNKGQYPPEQEKERQRMIQEAKDNHIYRQALNAIKFKLEFGGEDLLCPLDKKLIEKHHEFFYPDEEGKK